MKVAVFFSEGMSSGEAMLASREHGTLYEVVGTITNRDEKRAQSGYERSRKHGVEPTFIDPKRHGTRESFYEEATEKVAALKADIVALSGLLYKYSIIVDPFMRKFGGRILNVHPALLSLLIELDEDEDPWKLGIDEVKRRRWDATNEDYWIGLNAVDNKGHARLFGGADAVNMACFFGEEEVYSSVHVVDSQLDHGPMCAHSPGLRVDTEHVEKVLHGWNSLDALRAYAKGKLQEALKVGGDIPTYLTVLRLLAQKRMELFGDHVELDGEPLKYGGLQIGQGD